MNNIPTSKIFVEFLKKKGTIFPNEKEKLRAQNSFIEFAKLHVEAALEEALENSPTGSSTDIPSYEDMKNAILNAYPLTNIK
jgi:hypothetical protein